MLVCFSLIVACLSLVFSLITWHKTCEKRKYEVADNLLSDLNKITLQYPEFRDQEFCKSAVTSSDKKKRLRYESYAILVWNYLETLYDIYGENLRESPFYGAMKDLGDRHKTWLLSNDNMSYYNCNLIKFLRVDV